MKNLSKMSGWPRRLDNRGIAAIEYAMIASLIALSIIVGVANLGGAVGNQFNEVDTSVSAAGTKFEN